MFDMGTVFVCCEIVWLWLVSNSIGCVPRAKRLDGVTLVDWHFAGVFNVFALTRDFYKIVVRSAAEMLASAQDVWKSTRTMFFQEPVRFCVGNFDGLQHWAMEAFCPCCRHWIKYFPDELAHSNIDYFSENIVQTPKNCVGRGGSSWRKILTMQ